MTLFQIFLISFIAIIILISTGAVVAAFVMARFKRINDQLMTMYGTENDLKKRIEQYVAKVARDELSKLVEDYKQTLESGSREISESLKNVAEAQISTLGSFIKDQQGLITKQSEFIVGEITKKAQEDVEDYKKLQFDGIDLQVNDVVERVSREVLGRAITKEEHERLIWDAVQKAKAQGIFKEGVFGSLLQKQRKSESSPKTGKLTDE